ncbi:MAG: hypothetical protein HDR05_03495 [Lachnospiraceae bacterium]|nr:hypothetical protein [Lachnospiraceae bacterium]
MGRIIRKGIEVLAAILVFVGIVHGLNYMYVEMNGSYMWHRIVWHSYYENRGKIDNLYLGSSHVYKDIDPRILDELNGQYNFNLATPVQVMNGSFYLLKEADQDNELSHVYLEMYYACSADDWAINNEYYRNWNNTDFMEPSFNKIEYMIANGGLDSCLENLFPFTRYRTQLGDGEYVKKVTAYKKEDEYHTYQYHRDDGIGTSKAEFMPKGYYYTKKEYSDHNMIYKQSYVLTEDSMGDKSEQYCRKMIEYCQRKDIPITLFVSPMNDLQLISTEGYDHYINEVRKIADEYEIPFYDFNLAKEQYLPIQQNQYFQDLGHLNCYGVEVFTPFFYEVISGEAIENEKYFYASYADKLKETAPAIYGIYYRSDEGSKTVWIASNRDSEMEYRITLKPKEGEPYTVQDFDTNKEFTLSQGEEGICTITVRMKGSSEEIQTMEINY